MTDEETELFLAEILQPIYKAAGIRFYRNSVFIVEDNSLNAFVGDGNNMFVHTGTIMNADNYNQLSGVLAHETGHIQGGSYPPTEDETARSPASQPGFFGRGRRSRAVTAEPMSAWQF